MLVTSHKPNRHSLHLNEEQETHQVVVGVSAAALHDVHVLAPHGVVDVHVRLSCNQGPEHQGLMSQLTIVVETELRT